MGRGVCIWVSIMNKLQIIFGRNSTTYFPIFTVMEDNDLDTGAVSIIQKKHTIVIVQFVAMIIFSGPP